MNQQSNSYFKTVQKFVFKNLKSNGIPIDLDKKSPDFQPCDNLFFKLETLKIIFDKVNLYSSDLETNKFSDYKKFIIQDLQELVQFPFDDSVSNTKLCDIFSNSKNGFVYPVYQEHVYVQFKVFYSGEPKQIKLSAFPEVSDFIKNLSFDILVSKIQEMEILDKFLLSLNRPETIKPNKNIIVSKSKDMFQNQK